MKFSLVIPCFNESANLPLLLEKCKPVIDLPECEVILVNNGSTDNTAEVLKALLPKYLGCRSIFIEKNQGYGFGILEGLRSSKAEFIGWTHADMQTDPNDIIKGLAIIEDSGTDVFIKGRRLGRPIADVLFTLGMSFFETLLFAKPMWDINAQPTMFSRQFFECWEEPPSDFSLDLYAYFQAHEHGLKICRFPVKFGERAHGVSHWNINFAAKQKFIRRTLDFSLQLRKKKLK
jgi:glycosyltransferase involved in cell wall biosynthesis